MFKKYNAIENTYRTEFLERIKGHGFWEREYVVQEKAHGANLSYWTNNGVDFFAAKRTATIGADEKFYNYEHLLEAIQLALQNIWRKLTQQDPEIKQVTFFGELIGGSYPHPDVPRNRAAPKVQKGIFYSPDNHFYAFDILINAQRFLDVDEANRLFEAEGLLHAQTLFKGSLEACLTHSNAFDSTIPALLGLPTLTPNLCEGTIIKPQQEAYFNNGVRVILKNKNEKR